MTATSKPYGHSLAPMASIRFLYGKHTAQSMCHRLGHKQHICAQVSSIRTDELYLQLYQALLFTGYSN